MVYTHIVEMEPESETAHYNLAASLEAAGFLFEALEEYRKAFELDPSVPETRNNIDKLTLFMALESGIPGPLRLLDGTEIVASPDDASSHALLARLYARNEEYGRAIFHLKRALALEPDFAEAREMLAAIEKMRKEETSR